MYFPKLHEKLEVVDLLKFLDLISARDSELRKELYTHIRTSYHGNQQFSNDSLFIYNVEDDERTKLGKLIEDAAEENGLFSDADKEYIIFNVCW
ncbi:hypothetical protein VP464E531_P0019 [Vibrio phage 464E53-1]|nr:hypothetical protein VP464E531_P0019 [Vibrio phage 464E53-1]